MTREMYLKLHRQKNKRYNTNFDEEEKVQRVESDFKNIESQNQSFGAKTPDNRKTRFEESNMNNAYSFLNNQGGDEDAGGCQAYKQNMKIKLKGIGISLIDHQPKEICYISFYELRFKQFMRYSLNKIGVEKTRRQIEFKLLNMQIDNMTMRSFPVIFGPRKAFNFQENHQQTSEQKMTSQRIKCFELALAELSINFHQYFLNRFLEFMSSLSQLLSDELVNQFMNNSSIWANYAKLMDIMSLANEEQIFQDGKESISKIQGQLGALPPDGNEHNNDLQQLNIVAQNTYRSRLSIKEKFKTKEEICPFIKYDPITYDENQGYTQNKILAQEITIKALRIYLTFRVQKVETKKGDEGAVTSIINFFSTLANISEAQIYFSEIEIENAYSTLESIQSRLMKHYIKQGIEQIYQLFGATDIIGNPVGLINNLGRGVEEFYSEPFQGVLKGNAKMAALGLGKGIKGLAANTTIGISNSLARMSGTLYLTLKNLSGKQMSESNLDNPHDITSGLFNGTKGFAVEVGKGVSGLVFVPQTKVREQGKGCAQITKGTVQGLFGFVLTPVTGLLKLVHSVTTGTKNFAMGDDDRQNKRFRYPRYFDDREVMKPYDRIMSLAYTSVHLTQNGIFKNENILNANDISFFADNVKKLRYKERVLICTEERILFIQKLKKLSHHFLLKDLIDVQLVDSKLDLHSKNKNHDFSSWGVQEQQPQKPKQFETHPIMMNQQQASMLEPRVVQMPANSMNPHQNLDYGDSITFISKNKKKVTIKTNFPRENRQFVEYTRRKILKLQNQRYQAQSLEFQQQI